MQARTVSRQVYLELDHDTFRQAFVADKAVHAEHGAVRANDDVVFRHEAQLIPATGLAHAIEIRVILWDDVNLLGGGVYEHTETVRVRNIERASEPSIHLVCQRLVEHDGLARVRTLRILNVLHPRVGP